MTTHSTVLQEIILARWQLASMADLSMFERIGRSVRSFNYTEPKLWERFQAEVDILQPNNQFQAERYIPRVDPEGGNVTMDWQWGCFNAEMRTALDTAAKGVIPTNLATKSAELRARGTTKDTYAADALDEVIRLLRSNGMSELEAAIGSPAGPANAQQNSP